MVGSAELFRKRLRQALEKYGAGTELAKRSGISRSLIDKWARGDSSPGLDSLDRLAAALGVSPASLISDGEEEPWARVPKHLLVALAQVDKTHYPIIENFLESFTLERERSRVAAKVPERLEEPSRGRNKRSK